MKDRRTLTIKNTINSLKDSELITTGCDKKNVIYSLTIFFIKHNLWTAF